MKDRWLTHTFHSNCRFQSFSTNRDKSFVLFRPLLLFSSSLFPLLFFLTSISTDLHGSEVVRWNPRYEFNSPEWYRFAADTTLHYLSSAIGIFTATLYHLPCTVRDTICIEARVGLMENLGSRERNHTWMGFDIVSISWTTVDYRLSAEIPNPAQYSRGKFSNSGLPFFWKKKMIVIRWRSNNLITVILVVCQK